MLVLCILSGFPAMSIADPQEDSATDAEEAVAPAAETPPPAIRD